MIADLFCQLYYLNMCRLYIKLAIFVNIIERDNMDRTRIRRIVLMIFTLMVFFAGVSVPVFSAEGENDEDVLMILDDEDGYLIGDVPTSTLDLSKIPDYDGTPFIAVNDNMPDFYIWQLLADQGIHFSEFDNLGRTGAAMATLGKEDFPTAPRSQISAITPSGWQSTQYEGLIDQDYLYNRSHVIGYQFSGNDAVPENIFTGTRYLNADSMLFLEKKVMEYIEAGPEADSDDDAAPAEDEAGGHVLYRVTPVYKGNDLVASGVQMEAFSLEDFGESVCFNVYVYNVQPGVVIDYATGDNAADEHYIPGAEVSPAVAFAALPAMGSFSEEQAPERSMPAEPEIGSEEATASQEDLPEAEEEPEPAAEQAGENESKADVSEQTEPKEPTYILNTNTRKFHYPNCASVTDMKEHNKAEFFGTREEAVAAGYSPCGRCHP